ncbi:hypothetical protein RJ639_035966 [Escallonia herrerae]|uniref:Uncharacterized protein n=1 Tax=Escallonia herrerae TaxID=1293975 RepID=A0AA89B6U8_9ASTE|nr:hypothetical protein RJ639_035966 [Escallonia herrerae]
MQGLSEMLGSGSKKADPNGNVDRNPNAMASLPTTRTILAVQILTLFAGSFCAGGGVVEAIATLREALEKYWPSLSCGMTSTCHGGKGLFWAHEPRDCVNATSSCTDMISSKSSCPSYVSLPAYTSLVYFLPYLQGSKMVGLHAHGHLTGNLIDISVWCAHPGGFFGTDVAWLQS